jgi:hypothetical protein
MTSGGEEQVMVRCPRACKIFSYLLMSATDILPDVGPSLEVCFA